MLSSTIRDQQSQQNSISKLESVIGTAKPFVRNQLPTYRSILQKISLEKKRLIEADNLHFSQVTAPELAKRVAGDLTHHLGTVCPLLTTPIILSEHSVRNKVLKLFVKAVEVTHNRVTKTVKNRFLESLDKLFDLTSCQHHIRLCTDRESGMKTISMDQYKSTTWQIYLTESDFKN